MTTNGWVESSGGTTDLCSEFQLDLSRLVDGDLDERAAGRALVHLETCEGCSDFFDDTRRCVQLHRDMSDPDRLVARLTMLFGRDARDAVGIPTLDLEGVELKARLATIFYQLGKAYVLVGTNSEYRQRIFEEAVPVESSRLRGRGFVDGVVLSGRGEDLEVDWRQARGMLNGRLEAIEDPLEKAQRLLSEAVAVASSHEEARLYLAHLRTLQGQRMRGAEEYRQIFRTAIDEANRGHAAMQLGLLYDEERDHRAALRCFRWVTISGLVDRDERFFPARFNIGLHYAHLGRVNFSLAAFRKAIDAHPNHLGELADLFANSPKLRGAIEAREGFLEALVATCPELFGAESVSIDPDSGEF